MPAMTSVPIRTTNGDSGSICKEFRMDKTCALQWSVEETRSASRRSSHLVTRYSSPNVVYLNPESEYPPINDEHGVATVWLEQETGIEEFDSRPRLSDLPLGTDQHYKYAVVPSDEAPLFWPHQLYEIASSMVRDVRRVVASTANLVQLSGYLRNCHEIPAPGTRNTGDTSTAVGYRARDGLTDDRHNNAICHSARYPTSSTTVQDRSVVSPPLTGTGNRLH
jgi:hypothetical protein